jgi:nucleotide-binding universal stress UspA family protein
MYRSILVPLDGSPFGEHALPLALSIARRSGAQLYLAHVHVDSVPMFVNGMVYLDPTADIQARERERAYLDALATRLAKRLDRAITTTLLDGMVADALHDYATQIEADLVVLTTHGRAGLARAWLGSVADTLMRRLPIPVLLVRPPEAAPDLNHEPVVARILIPLDGSTLAEQVLAHAMALGRPMQAAYTLLQAIDPVILGYTPAAYAMGLDELIIEQERVAAQSYLAEIAERLRAESLRVETNVAIGPSAAAILDYAHAHRVDLIALATHGRGGLQRWLLGSVADKVVRGASVPVLVYRPQAEIAPH